MREVSRALAVGPGAVVSTLWTWAVCAVVPQPWGVTILGAGLVILGVLALGGGESTVARLICRARLLEQAEVVVIRPALTLLSRSGLGPPVVELRVCHRDRRIAVEPLGRRTVVLSTGLIDAVIDGRISQEQVAALVAHPAGLVRAGWFRHDLALVFCSLPWLVMRGVARALAASLGRLPLTTAAWRLRPVVVTIAVVQALQQGLPWLAGMLLTLGALSYLLPVWERQWESRVLRAGDQAVADAGLAAPWAALLRRQPASQALRDRLRHLDPPLEVQPVLSLVPTDATHR